MYTLEDKATTKQYIEDISTRIEGMVNGNKIMASQVYLQNLLLFGSEVNAGCLLRLAKNDLSLSSKSIMQSLKPTCNIYTPLNIISFKLKIISKVFRATQFIHIM